VLPGEVGDDVGRLLGDDADVLGPLSRVVEDGVRVGEPLEGRQLERQRHVGGSAGVHTDPSR